MSLTLFIPTGAAANVVQVPTGIDFSRQAESGTVHSGIRFSSTGVVFAKTAGGAWQAAGTWLVAGSASTYYLSRTIDSGTLTTDAGAGPLQMNTTRDYDRQKSGGFGVVSCMLTFSISNDVSGSPVVASGSITLEVERGSL